MDSSRLRRAINWRMAAVKSKRSLRQVVCTVAHEVALGAIWRTPAVMESTITNELNVFVMPRYGKKGKLLQYRRVKRTLESRKGTATVHPEVPLAALVIQARTNYQSVYNARTNWRYYTPSSPFKGVSRAAGRALMRAKVNQMIQSRRRSTHFLQAGWKPVIHALAPESMLKSRLPSWSFNPMKGVVTIVDNGSRVSVTIENAVGLFGKNAANFNRALWEHGAPALQRSIDVAEIKMIGYIRNKLAADDAVANAMMR